MKLNYAILSVTLLSVGSILFPSFAFSENFTSSELNATEIASPKVNATEAAVPEANATEISVPKVNAAEGSVAIEASTGDEASSFSQMPPGLTKYEKFEKLKEKADKDKKVRVILGLDTGFMPEGKLDFDKVKKQKDTIKQYQESILEKLDSYNASQIHEFKHVPFMAMSVDKKALERLEADLMIASITEDVLHRPTLVQSVPLIGAPAVWSSGSSGQGQAVAILDSGVEKGHLAFAGGKVVSEACYSTTFAPDGATSLCPGGDAESTASDSALPCNVSGCDHGTHVAGIAAGNDVTIQGVAIGADIIAIQVFSKIENNPGFCGSPQPCIGAYTGDIIKGLDRVLELSSSMDISSVNLSLGFGGWSDEVDCDSDNSGLKISVDNLMSVEIATVASSGNDFSPTTIGSPACISSVVSVGSTTDTTDVVSSFSNSAIFLDLLAPGQVIDSAVPPTGYAPKSGTSMASPHVAGAFALLKSFDPAITVDDALNALKNTGVPILDSRPGNGFTFPRIQVDAALNSLTPKTVISFEDYQSGFNTWTNTSGDDNDCWKRDSNGTPTGNTGPSTGAAATTWYAYYESSSGCSAEFDQAFLLGPVIDFNAFNGVEVVFWRHMWDGGAWNGDDMGRLALELETSQGSGTFTEVWSQQGNQGNQWNQITVDLSAEDNTGQRQFRFVATDIAVGGQSDMAVDEIAVRGVSVGPPQSSIIISFEDFEVGFTTWTNTSGDDNDCLKRDELGTPTSNTGPSTGAAATNWYVFYESSIPGGCGGAELDEAFLLGPVIDFSAYNSVQVIFWRHMWDGGAFNGDDMGRLALELEDSPGSGTFTEVWFQQGNQGNQWNQIIVDLSAEDNTGQRQFRFVATDIAVGVQSDMAVDEITIRGVSVSPPISFEDYESGFNTWTNTSGDDNDCWKRDSNGTPTSNTGPSTGAAATNWYVFYESSIPGGCGGAELDQAFLLGPTIDFDAFNDYEITFWRHMWDGGAFNGDDMGRLALELEDSPSSGTFTEVWFQQGNQGNQWDQITVDLSAQDNTGQRQIRFVATDISVGIQSDMAVDEITILGNAV